MGSWVFVYAILGFDWPCLHGTELLQLWGFLAKMHPAPLLDETGHMLADGLLSFDFVTLAFTFIKSNGLHPKAAIVMQKKATNGHFMKLAGHSFIVAGGIYQLP